MFVYVLSIEITQKHLIGWILWGDGFELALAAAAQEHNWFGSLTSGTMDSD